MPIGRGEFEKGEVDLRLVIIEFLRVDSDYAYSLEEIIEHLTSGGIVTVEEEVRGILADFVDKKRIELKSVGGVCYYMFCKTLGFRLS